MAHTSNILSGMRAIAAIVAIALLTTSAVDPRAQTPEQNEQARKDQIWQRAEPAVMAYMNESAAMVGQGFALAYTGFVDWYTNVLIPGVKEERAIIKVAQWVFEQSLKTLSELPGVGQVTKMAIDVFVDAFKNAVTKSKPGALTASFMAALNAELEAARTRGLTVARRFETNRPSDFEAAMFAYLNEEVATPGIHAASEFGMGKTTRKKLAQLGFPEPGERGARLIAEAVLTPMVLAAQKGFWPQRSRIFNQDQLHVVAEIETRRYLFPKDRAYICKNAFLLSLLAPDDCR